MENENEFRKLPAVDKVVAALEGPHPLRTAAARRAVDEARARVRAGEDAPSLESVTAAARSYLEDGGRALLQPVINATGVLVHTNLGRVPLGGVQLDAVLSVASGYSNLEYDLAVGRRGSRYSHAQELINSLIGSEASLVVNNNAAAVLLMLSALCRDREVIISRGELIEIGGEFRIPDVMANAGVRLVEVGTTNRTHISDYERAITPDTAAILKVHPSNYKVVGFTKSVASRELARLAQGRRVYFFHDLGSGLVSGPAGSAFATEPEIAACLSEGADLITFSGDKLLGGPQAGIIAGHASLIAKLAGHPLLRALRVDKMTLAALQATLRLYLEGRMDEIPLWAMALAPLDELERRARAIAAAVGGAVGPDVKVDAVVVTGVAGGGSLPGEEFPSWAVTVDHPSRSADELGRALRSGAPPVIARIEDDRLLLDVRTVAPADDPTLIALLSQLS